MTKTKTNNTHKLVNGGLEKRKCNIAALHRKYAGMQQNEIDSHRKYAAERNPISP
jgi:hypothetical protein